MQHNDTIRYNTITSVPIHTSIRYSGESNNYIITVYEGVSGGDIIEYDVYNIAVAANYLNHQIFVLYSNIIYSVLLPPRGLTTTGLTIVDSQTHSQPYKSSLRSFFI